MCQNKRRKTIDRVSTIDERQEKLSEKRFFVRRNIKFGHKSACCLYRNHASSSTVLWPTSSWSPPLSMAFICFHRLSEKSAQSKSCARKWKLNTIHATATWRSTRKGNRINTFFMYFEIRKNWKTQDAFDDEEDAKATKREEERAKKHTKKNKNTTTTMMKKKKRRKPVFNGTRAMCLSSNENKANEIKMHTQFKRTKRNETKRTASKTTAGNSTIATNYDFQRQKTTTIERSNRELAHIRVLTFDERSM